MRPRIFIGSSTEGLPVAEEIQLALSGAASVSVWTNDVFRLSEFTLESLFKQLDRTDYAVFVLSDDDLVTVRRKQGYIPRDNVLFELGLFSGRLGRRKVFMVHPQLVSLRLPTDLLGVTTATYQIVPGESLSAALAPVATRIKRQIAEQSNHQVISWREYVSLVDALIKKLKRPSGRGGFSFDTIVGISRGGIIAADLIARHYGMNIPVVCLWADLHSNFPAKTFKPPPNWINKHVVEILADNRIHNILLVDDINRSGVTMMLAREFLVSSLPQKNIRTGSLIVDKQKTDHVDFYSEAYDTSYLQLPYYELG
jgi:hypoxanthine phosphoribosyltransferase